MNFSLWLFVIKKLAQTQEMSEKIYEQMDETTKKELQDEYKRSGF